MRQRIYLAVSLDVEEEGLFCDRYATSNVTVENTASLLKLAPLFALGIRPTLFCAYPVLQDARSRAILTHLRDTFGCELALHLHHWNTPPIKENAPKAYTRVPSASLSEEEFAAKIASLQQAMTLVQKEPATSFRMGRWDLLQKHFALLAKAGIKTDCSVRPLHGQSRAQTPDHFGAPSAPYWVPTSHGDLFEVPLTVTPLLPATVRLLQRLRSTKNALQGIARTLSATMHYWGALALLPCYHPLWAMEAISALYIRRGGRLLSLTWHSSELHPGATPHLPTEEAVQKLLTKIQRYISFLQRNYDVVSLPMHEVRATLGDHAPHQTASFCDWTTPPTTF